MGEIKAKEHTRALGLHVYQDLQRPGQVDGVAL